MAAFPGTPIPLYEFSLHQIGEEKAMFNDPRDINRADVDPNYRDPAYVAPPADDAGWGLPLAILAVVVVIGGLFWFGHGNDTMQTAANQPQIERTIPPATPSPAAPAPMNPAPPAKAPQQ
jgi:hypothetical protein